MWCVLRVGCWFERQNRDASTQAPCLVESEFRAPLHAHKPRRDLACFLLPDHNLVFKYGVSQLRRIGSLIGNVTALHPLGGALREQRSQAALICRSRSGLLWNKPRRVSDGSKDILPQGQVL